MPKHSRIGSWGLLLCATLLGCPTTKEEQLQNVAKDWSLVIRASQVIPVYPLTEDLRPGDIFLVETPLQEAEQYKGKGYLRLDQHLARLHGLDYQEFYEKSHGVIDDVKPPAHWQFPPKRERNTATPPPGTEPNKHTEETAWSRAPRAAFPTYTFKVSSGSGAKLALPISGVPVGLSLMQTDSATGTVTLADAYTYGVSLHELHDKILRWSREHDHRTLLREIRQAAGREVYVRAVSRVYLTGRVVVNMSNTRAFNASGKAGVSDDVTLPPSQGTAAERAATPGAGGIAERAKAAEKAKTEAIAAAMKGVAPGGAFKVMQASSRTVAMSETFPRPIVVGFLGFDFPVLESGELGPPASTRARLGDDPEKTKRIGVLPTYSQEYIDLRNVVAAEERVDVIQDAAAAELGGNFEVLYRAKKAILNKAARSPQNCTRAFKSAKDDSGTSTREAYRALRLAWDAETNPKKKNGD